MESKYGAPWDFKRFNNMAASMSFGEDFIEKVAGPQMPPSMPQRWENPKSRRNVMKEALTSLLAFDQRYCASCLYRFNILIESEMDHIMLRTKHACQQAAYEIMKQKISPVKYAVLMDIRHQCTRCHQRGAANQGGTVSALEKGRPLRMRPLAVILNVALTACYAPTDTNHAVTGVEFVLFDDMHNRAAIAFLPGIKDALGLSGKVSHIVCARSDLSASDEDSAAVHRVQDANPGAVTTRVDWLADSIRTGKYQDAGGPKYAVMLAS